MKNRTNFCFLVILVTLLLANNSLSQDAFNLRSITAGVNITQENYLEVLEKTKAFLEKGRAVLEKDGFTLQGVRIATNPFLFYTKGLSTGFHPSCSGRVYKGGDIPTPSSRPHCRYHYSDVPNLPAFRPFLSGQACWCSGSALQNRVGKAHRRC